ncbi:class I SAM-dependent methyltransferase [Sphingomonas sp. 28-63-12]|uniref:class I SAM-dependent methyltransferase n=1 Tax=Sphingomonas sp. 28-63-12 TaxID=1970434 RepID=UPI000BCE5F50|nr:MAG: hypothetical protein B7Y47_04830 [Sphingomonas sp. 28-63-12]
MSASEHPTSDDWAGARGEKWLAQLARMESMLAPVDAPLIAQLALKGTRRIADLACGGGGTTLALAAAADPGAAVFGYDISPALVAFAQTRAAAHDPAPVFALGDSATLAVDPPFDRIISRFGTMFFADPAAAFANMATLLAPGGRFAFAVWGPPADNRWMAIVRETVGELIDLPPPPVDAPGPLRYGDVQVLLRLLGNAGFRDVTVGDWSDNLAIGGDLEPRAAAQFALETMSVAQALAGGGAHLLARATDLLTGRFEARWSDGAVRLPARVHLVSGGR